MNNKIKEDLLEYEDTTDDTRISELDYSIFPLSKSKNLTYNYISKLNNIINNKDSISSNNILQQRENRKIISQIKKILQKKESKDIESTKKSIKEIFTSSNLNIILLRDDKRDSLLHIYVKMNDIFSLNIILEIYIEFLGISKQFFNFLFLKNNKGFTAIDLSVQYEYIPIMKLLYQQLTKGEKNIDIINYMEYLRIKIFNISAKNNKIYPIIFFYEKLYKFYNNINANETINLLDNKEENLDTNGMTPILYASKNKNLKLLLILLDLGANINSQNNKGYTSLHYAVENNDERMVKHLLIRGADKFIKDKNNINVFNLAVLLKHENLAKILFHKNFFQKIFCGSELGKISGKSSMIFLICFLLFGILVKIIIFLRIYLVSKDININFSPFSTDIKTRYELNEFLNCLEEYCISEIILFMMSLVVDLLFLLDFIIFKFSKEIFLPKRNNVKEKLSKLYEKDENVCVKCGIKKKQNTKHCIICDRCVDNWDHHCYWLNSCINHKNFCKFKLFLYFSFVYLISNLLFYLYSIYVTFSSKELFFKEVLNIEIKSIVYYFVIVIIVSVIIVLIVFIIYLIIFVSLPMIKYICSIIINKKNIAKSIETIIESDDSFNKIFDEKDEGIILNVEE